MGIQQFNHMKTGPTQKQCFPPKPEGYTADSEAVNASLTQDIHQLGQAAVWLRWLFCLSLCLSVCLSVFSLQSEKEWPGPLVKRLLAALTVVL